jgi:ATP-dependent HslUV protease, peptidase subunit HslV
MSIAVAIKKGKDVFIGADSQQSVGSNRVCLSNISESKIRRIGSVLMASTGWGLYDDILDDYLKEKKAVKLTSKMEVFRFFKDFWHALHKNYSFVNDQCDDKDSPFGDLDASFIIATKTKIFYVSANMCVTEFHKFHAIGSGCEFAIGAMHVLYDLDFSADLIAQKAIEAAITHNVYCGGKIEVIKL